MNKSLKSAVRKYFKYAKKADYIGAEQCAKALGYNVILFNTAIGDEKLIECKCMDEAKKYRAFTHFGLAKIIFIDGRQSPEDRCYLLLHEIGHILLGHIGDGKRYSRNSILIDVEANAFVNAVLEHKKISVLSVLYAAVVLAVGIAIGISIPIDLDIRTITVPASTSNEMYDSGTSDNQSEIVYVTRVGTKFHRADCVYTKDKDCIAMSRAEAVQSYAPCKICKP